MALPKLTAASRCSDFFSKNLVYSFMNRMASKMFLRYAEAVSSSQYQGPWSVADEKRREKGGDRDILVGSTCLASEESDIRA